MKKKTSTETRRFLTTTNALATDEAILFIKRYFEIIKN